MESDICCKTGWLLEETGFNPGAVVLNGNKYLLGNGSMGYRGTLEEFGSPQLVGNMVAGLYDKAGDLWREPVNAPNALFAQVIYKGTRLGVLESEIQAHRQALDIRHAIHHRQTVFTAGDGNRITVTAERFLSLAQRNVIAMEYSVCCEQAAPLEVETGIDLGIWDINGPHLEAFQLRREDGILSAESKTRELGIPLCVAESVVCGGFEAQEAPAASGSLRRLAFFAEPGQRYRFWKFATVFKGGQGIPAPREAARAACAEAQASGYAALRKAHEAEWERYWQASDIQIEGAPEAQFALRYSLYHLLAIAPPPGSNLSIPARGLSGQVYKGAVFWDTEMFMVPFFQSTQPGIARSLLLYRYHTLEGARRKAREYGFEGAFYAWESQESGDDACSLFNVTDVFTGRPMRTYFRDKQIHISAAVAYAFWQYYQNTGDYQVFLEGGAEVVLECARFFYSYAHYKEPKCRYELLDVTGPDEYHERVNNNAYTNRMALETCKIALHVVELLAAKNPAFLSRLTGRLHFDSALPALRRFVERLHIPAPDPESGLIPQFDGYGTLENIPLATLKSRILNPGEYLGGGNGLATTTQILKQADVVLMLSLFGDDYAREIKKRNWLYYEPRTEHGSSLSACAYAMVASEIGEIERAYDFFLQTATIDLTGKSKQYIGPLYIGGTHPAANGAAWIVTVRGFAGLKTHGEAPSLNPRLPKAWKSLRFGVQWRGMRFRISILPAEVRIEACPDNQTEVEWIVCGQPQRCAPGKAIVHSLPS